MGRKLRNEVQKKNKQPNNNNAATQATIQKAKEGEMRKALFNKGLITIGGQNYSPLSYNNGSTYGTSGPKGSMMIVERTEPIGVVASGATPGAFNAQQFIFYPMNATLAWLQNMANSFTSYEVLRAEFTYVPIVPTTVAGAVGMGFNEDLRDDTPTTLSQLLTFEQSLMAPVYAGGEGGRYLQQFGSPGGNVVSFELPPHVIQNAAGVPHKFRITKPANITAALAGADGSVYAVSSYSPGRLMIGVDGVTTANTNVGQVFIRYKMRLSGAVNIALQQ